MGNYFAYSETDTAGNVYVVTGTETSACTTTKFIKDNKEVIEFRKWLKPNLTIYYQLG